MKVKLSYFDIEGTAEPVRLAFILAGIPFEDDRIKFTQWPEFKKTTPYGQVPVLQGRSTSVCPSSLVRRGDRTREMQWNDLGTVTRRASLAHHSYFLTTSADLACSPSSSLAVDDEPLKTQSPAMMRWAASVNPSKNLYPADKLYQIEEASGLLGDMKGSWSPCLYISMKPTTFGYPSDYPKTPEGAAKVESMRTEWISNELPQYLGYISDMIDKNGGTWLAGGDSPTIADCEAIPAIRNYMRGHIDHVPSDCVAKASPKVAAYVERFCALEEIAGRYA